jgi:parallel beta-helix repeat protein
LTVKNGTLTNFEDGVVAVNGADGVTVSNVTVSGNVTAGIWVNGSAAKIQSVTASGNGQYAFGVRVIGDFANISSVEADANGTSGIVVTGDSALIQTSTAYGNMSNEYGHVGIGITGNAGTIKSSTANGNVTGIAISGDNGTIQSSTANGNSGGGIIVSASSAPATVTSSTANGNRYEGISLNGVDAGVIQGNQANANGFANAGAGIQVFFQIAPTGTNVAHGNADPAECVPANLC